MEHRVAESQARAFGEYDAARVWLEKEKHEPKDRRPWREPGEYPVAFGFASAAPANDPGVSAAAPPEASEPGILKQARENLVIKQLLPCGVIAPRVLDAFLQIPRDLFIPGYEGSTVAYADASFPVGEGRVCMEPRVLGLLLQELKLAKEKDLLLIGCGSGYEAAVASRIARHVTAIECREEMIQKAQARLARLGIGNVCIVKVDSLTDRFRPNFAPYDAALINGAIERDPPSHYAGLLKQGNLMREGGMLVTVKRESEYLGTAMRYLNIRGKLYGRGIAHAQVPPLPEFKRPKGFEF